MNAGFVPALTNGSNSRELESLSLKNVELAGTRRAAAKTTRGQQEPSPERRDRSTRPENQALDIFLAFAIAVFAVLWTLPSLNFFHDPDEGIVFQCALRILRGELPYRDFFCFYTPGSYYLYALLFRVFGPAIWAPRILLLLYAALFSGITYLLARRLYRRSSSVVTAVLLALICPACRPVVLHNWDSTATTLLAVYFGVLLLETNSYLLAFLSGLFAGFTVMIEQSKGAGLLLGFVIAATIILLLYRPRWNRAHALSIAAGTALPAMIGFGYFAYRGALSNLVLGVLWPLKHYVGPNKLPYGYWFVADVMADIIRTGNVPERLLAFLACSSVLVIVASPLIVLGFGTAVLCEAIRNSQRRTYATRLVTVLTSVLVGLFLSNLATARPDFIRFVYAAPIFFPLLPALLDRRFFDLPWLSRTRSFLAWYCLFGFLYIGFLYISPTWHPSARVLTRRGALTASSPDEVIPYVIRHVPEGGDLLSYPYNAEYSYLTGTFNPIYFDFLQQGMHTKEEFESARDQFARRKTSYVLYDLTFPTLISTVWPATSADKLAVDPLGDYILANYRTCKVLRGRGRPFLFMALKGTACPAD